MIDDLSLNFLSNSKQSRRRPSIFDDLATAITYARYWKIRKAMVTLEKNNINIITKQLV
ncbi:1682_t:CDS:2 [Cetraspora pellucida]|uniref:1682_t:CDS:1 n=1 Tax=Cetraspora pellucida TaxID=1433469 RepID=A0ACA9KNT6_9GLOM|nr:1682_t:CDS:2 [Cetraspora pellucida]